MICGIFFIGSKLTHLRKPRKISVHDSWEKVSFKISLKIGSITTEEHDEVEVLRRTIDRRLKF